MISQVDYPDLRCGTSEVNVTICPDQKTCQQNCVIEGISDYTSHGVLSNGSDLTLLMLGKDGTQHSPRIYLLNEAEDAYEVLKLTGQEFTFEVDMSKLPCGMNSALYLVEMDGSGGKDLSPDIPVAGAPYGTGYCDAQCFTTAFANGLGNVNGSGVCCAELDIWEANARATQFAPHTCNETGVYLCDRASGACGPDGVCDKSGCGMNPYKASTEFYGLRKAVDTTRPFSVVSQFPADASGVLTSYKRLYIQDGKVFETPAINVGGLVQNYMDDAYCTAAGAADYMDLGATKGMGDSMSRGMVLVFSLWWDTTSFMSWLDQSSSGAGPCNATEGNPAIIKTIQPDTQVTFSNVRWGDIGSTFSKGGSP
ncbi:unnamed protein product [Discula destructiva]